MGVIFVALMHALPVYLLARLTRSRWVLLITAVGSSILAVYIGGGKYVVYDILGVLIAATLAWPLTQQIPEEQLVEIGRGVTAVGTAAANTTGRALKAVFKGVAWMIVIGLCATYFSKALVGEVRKSWEEEDRQIAAAAENLPLVEVKNRCYALHRDAEQTKLLKPQREADQVCTVYERRAEHLRPRLDDLLHEAQRMTAAIHKQCMEHYKSRKADAQYRDDAMDLACDDYKAILERSASRPKG